jgi:hypothetical protein
MDTENTFYKAPKNLWRANGYISPKTKEIVLLKESEKIVYTYMLDRLVFFVEKQGGEHFESQETIATGCGLEYRVVGRILRGFMENDVLFAKKVRPNDRGQWRWVYTRIVKDLKFWYRSGVDKKVVKSSKSQKPYIPLLGEDADCPF